MRFLTGPRPRFRAKMDKNESGLPKRHQTAKSERGNRLGRVGDIHPKVSSERLRIPQLALEFDVSIRKQGINPITVGDGLQGLHRVGRDGFF